MELAALPQPGQPLTMSSRELADLTGSAHDNVLRTHSSNGHRECRFCERVAGATWHWCRTYRVCVDVQRPNGGRVLNFPVSRVIGELSIAKRVLRRMRRQDPAAFLVEFRTRVDFVEAL